MDIILNKEKKKEEMHTAMDVSEDAVARSEQVVNEVASVSSRSGRKGFVQTALGLGQRNNKVSSTNGNDVFRVVISKESNDSLEVVLGRCSEGFDSGTITKSDVANFVFQNLEKFFSESDIKTLRAAHFDEKKVLGAILRNDDDLPEDLRKAIRSHFGIATYERDRKRSSK